MEGKSKRLFPFEENCAISNKIKKVKVHTNQMSNSRENVSISEHNFLKYSKAQSSERDKKSDKEHVSLVEKMIPTNITAYIGQEQIIGPGTVLGYLLEKREIPSMIFWGPPGCGKTSLTSVIACLSREIAGDNVHIVNLSAISSGVKNIRDAVTTAMDKSKFGCKTIVFMDEIHCFNKLQQDIFLPHVEAGTFTLIGCTTENPSYSLNPALLSRCRVFILNKLTDCNITEILHKAIEYMNGNILDVQERNEMNREQLHSHSNFKFCIDNNTIQWLAEACDGDARVALNTLELAVLAKRTNRLKTSSNNYIILKDIKENLIKSHMLSEKETNQSHHMYSALHKSIRAGKANASLYWMARIMAAKEDPVNIARRLVRISSEDIGLADPDALGVAVDTMYGCQMIGMPECDVLLGQCTVYLAKAPKSRSIYNALKAAEKIILEHKNSQPTVPLHIENIGCLPTELQHINLFQEKRSIHPWETVAQAAWRKYPNPMVPSVIGADVIDRKVVDGVLHTHRLVVSTQWGFPKWTQALIGYANLCYASERSEVDPVNREMILRTHNLTFGNYIAVDEAVRYTPHPTDPNKTLLTQEAVVTVRGVPLTNYMEDLLASKISFNASKGRQGLEWVINKLESEMKEFA